MPSTSNPKLSTSVTHNTKNSISRYPQPLSTQSPSTVTPSAIKKASPKKKRNNAMLEYYLAESPRDGANMYCRCHSGYHPTSTPSSAPSRSSATTSPKKESTAYASKAVDAFDTASIENR